MLNKASEEQKDFACQLKLEQYSLRDIALMMEEKVEYKASVGTYQKFFKSVEGERRMRSLHEKLAADWKEEPLAEKYSRVHALVEQATRLRRELRLGEPQDKEWRAVSSEFRMYLDSIRRELEGVQVTVNEIQSPWVSFLEEEGLIEPEAEDVQESTIQ